MHDPKQSMNEVVLTAFHNTFAHLPGELAIMPLSRWSESVFRYHFCRALALADPRIEQLLECDRIDLVLRLPPLLSFIEFKFYVRPRKCDPYHGFACGYKGGPSSQNLSEFQKCVDRLSQRPSVPSLSKYIVLAYVEYPEEAQSRRTYSSYYDEYRHANCDIHLRKVECSSPISTVEGIVRGNLYEIETVALEIGSVQLTEEH
jgi:hypothetical protein